MALNTMDGEDKLGRGKEHGRIKQEEKATS
jgi:hypothetical protein